MLLRQQWQRRGAMGAGSAGALRSRQYRATVGVSATARFGRGARQRRQQQTAAEGDGDKKNAAVVA